MCELLKSRHLKPTKKVHYHDFNFNERIQRGWGEGWLPGKSDVAMGFLRNTGKDPYEKQCDPLCQFCPNQYTFSVDL